MHPRAEALSHPFPSHAETGLHLVDDPTGPRRRTAPRSPLRVSVRAFELPDESLTHKIAAKVNAGAAAWRQDAVYRTPSMPCPPTCVSPSIRSRYRRRTVGAAPGGAITALGKDQSITALWWIGADGSVQHAKNYA
jgi:hypothetical protein